MILQQLKKKVVEMDPQRKSFQLCELASCTDLPVFEDQVRQKLFLPGKTPSSGDDDYESLETSSSCSYDSRFVKTNIIALLFSSPVNLRNVLFQFRHES